MSSPPSLSSIPRSTSLESMMALATRVSRKPRTKTTFLALFSLICMSSYVFFFLRPDMSYFPALPSSNISNARTAAARKITAARESFAFRKMQMDIWAHGAGPSAARGPPLVLNPAQELAAVSSFLASLPQNVIPASVDPNKPIDPQLVLDFDTRSLKAPAEVQAMVADVWSANPVVLYAKHYSPQSRELKTLLSSMHLDPPALVFDVDKRADASVLEPLIVRLIASSPHVQDTHHTHDLPLLLIGGKPVGSIAEIKSMHKSGVLKRLVVNAGGVVGAKRRKHGRTV